MRRSWKIACVLAGCLGSSGCTVVKPVVGVFTAPVLLMSGHYGGSEGVGTLQGEGGARAAVIGMAAIGAVGGLVTGVLSDWAVLTRATQEPTRNWWDPLATNSDAVCR